MNCGTQAGYQRHRYHGEPTCPECRAANAQDARNRRVRKAREYMQAQCGTTSGYKRHVLDQTPPCEPCRKAHRDALWSWRNRAPEAASISDCIVDVLSTHLRWITREVLVDMVLDLHPDWKPDSIRRALSRSVEAGRIRVRPDVDDPMGTRFEYFSDEWAAA